jgi:hypothetical protein
LPLSGEALLPERESLERESGGHGVYMRLPLFGSAGEIEAATAMPIAIDELEGGERLRRFERGRVVDRNRSGAIG